MGAPNHDHDGNPRPLGVSCDIGAYEYVDASDQILLTIEMSSQHFNVGDIFWCNVTVENKQSEALNGYPLFVILDVFGLLFFAPEFNEFGYYNQTFQPGLTTVAILPEFSWPTGAGKASGIFWYAALTNPGFTTIISNLNILEFGWN
ncbi:hypothetical protein K8T06_18425 [bacterium]|nr:hypothetical protein [bacterium]